MLKRNLFFALLMSTVTANVFAFDPTPAQIQQFQSLPKAQQEQLARQYGVSIDTLTGQSSDITTDSTPKASQVERTTAASSKVVSKPVSKEDTESLTPFGYDVFSGKPMDFSNVDSLPVPLDYVMANGDEILVQIYGKTSRELALTIDREGLIYFPEFGPIAVSGQTFADLRAQVIKLVKQRVMGVDVVVSLGSMRSMQVFIVGESIQPGAYNVNGLTSITQALIASGGVKETGSLRNIQLKRKGKIIASLDLYDLLLKGDASNDVRLLAGDTLFIPTKQSNVSIEGEVVRPAVYEMNGKITVSQFLKMAGGAKPSAYLSKINLRRTSSTGIEQFTLDMNKSNERNFTIKNGDSIHIAASSKSLKNAVAIRGEVVRQGALQFIEGMKVNDVISSVDNDLKQNADLSYALIVREVNEDRDISVLQFNLLNAIKQPNSRDNLQLQEKDQIFVFDNGIKVDYWFDEYTNNSTNDTSSKNLSTVHRDADTGALIINDADKEINTQSDQAVSAGEEVQKSSRQLLLAPIIERLKSQSNRENTTRIINIGGAIKFPGTYPLPENSDISKVISAAGGFEEQAYLKTASITRSNTDSDEFSVSTLTFPLEKALTGAVNFDIRAKDSILIKTQPNWHSDMFIELQGEVVFPGKYAFQRGDRLEDIIERAGGFTKFAYPEGAIFSRVQLKRQEQERLRLLNMQLKQEISSLALRRQSSTATYSTPPTEAMTIADELSNTVAMGRLVIDMKEAMLGDNPANVMLEQGDKLYIPALNPVVSIMGEVQFSSNHTFKPGMTIDEYLSLAGGTKKQADTDRIYIVKANGSVQIPNNSFWFKRSTDKPLSPGDTIIVPIDTDYLDGLSTLTSATQILYQIGVAWSAVKD